ncbi:MAG: hypothetical protein EB009_05525 [Actinobacteria bacterium]|nr:hypothetical protein [Actinomycetota bacterium]
MDLTQSTKAFSFRTCGIFLGLISETLAISSPSSAALAESAPTSSRACANCLLSLSLASLAASAECVEVTPNTVRIRKVIFDQNERSRLTSKAKKANQ